jgi:hypothetical protein
MKCIAKYAVEVHSHRYHRICTATILEDCEQQEYYLRADHETVTVFDMGTNIFTRRRVGMRYNEHIVRLSTYYHREFKVLYNEVMWYLSNVEGF